MVKRGATSSNCPIRTRSAWEWMRQKLPHLTETPLVNTATLGIMCKRELRPGPGRSSHVARCSKPKMRVASKAEPYSLVHYAAYRPGSSRCSCCFPSVLNPIKRGYCPLLGGVSKFDLPVTVPLTHLSVPSFT